MLHSLKVSWQELNIYIIQGSRVETIRNSVVRDLISVFLQFRGGAHASIQSRKLVLTSISPVRLNAQFLLPRAY